ncbi:nuclear factor NF-kappa-B p110 subunit isoform X2 [Dendroctonus ponderosae]|uniref:nuclear factor NF-kappa-B p110 subunit isoform X2 n=1 Tax=Dendroctonus ponderosae TaxID=77166 RepID=UPI0020356171|nr:nuclear factor NF-kappa-B p110 subunit isoform X2 [Dendroctonus ponderosae]
MLFDQHSPDSNSNIDILNNCENDSWKFKQSSNEVLNMATYPTPPSSSGDSPQPIFLISSPNSQHYSVVSPEGSQHYIQAQIVSTNSSLMDMDDSPTSNVPYLKFLEQPTNKFRFRYKSEMAGTHGSLCGMNSDRSRKQTYPTVELVNCTEKATVRCCIYQYNIEDDFKPHPHRLIMKKGRSEEDDPHDILVGPEEGFTATFHSMGIIHTARKNIVSELVRKKSLLHRELIASREGRVRELTLKELTDIKGLAQEESKSINLNIVRLRFDAFVIKNGIRHPICPPIYSHGINNLKCALTGDLRIVRMDHCTSPAKGGQEIFLLVERVTKKNIQIRFFELNDDEQEVWQGWGKFSELDVHHQYAIVFKTPMYDRNPNITQPVKVYMELVRPSDSAKSEWKEFRFIPSNEFRPGSKRPRSNGYETSSTYNSSSLNSVDLPATIPHNLAQCEAQNQRPISLPNTNSWNQSDIISDEQMDIALRDINSTEFGILFEEYAVNEFDTVDQNTVDCSPQASISDRLRNVYISGLTKNSKTISSKSVCDIMQSPNCCDVIKMEVLPEDLSKANRTYQELKNFIKSRDARERAPEMLQYHLGDHLNTRRSNALHVFVALNRKEEVTFLLKMLVLSRKFELTNIPNSEWLTPLHIAAHCRNDEFVEYLLQCKANPLIQDNNGRTALHMAIKSVASLSMLEMLLKKKFLNQLIDLEDYEGRTPLNLAIETRNLMAIKTLCLFGADVNKKHHKNGFTPLRHAIEMQYVEAIQLLLLHPMLDIGAQTDFQGLSPFQFAIMNSSSKEVMEIINKFAISKGIQIEVKKEIEDEEEDDEDMEEEIELKHEVIEPIDNPELLYTNITNFTPKCLDEVSAILDDSGKYAHLADLLDLTHLLDAGVISSERSISKHLLQYAIEKDNVKILEIRNFLENLDEYKAVTIIDQMAHEFQLR